MMTFAGTQKNRETGESISKIAAHYLDSRPRLTMEACNGLVIDILADAGIEIKGRVDSLWEQGKQQGWAHHKKTPKSGDLVFWHRTYDRNRNGRVDDQFTHIGVVIRVDENETIHMVHRGSRGIKPLRMNLYRPDTYKADGLVYNDFLAASGYGHKDERLAGQLFAGFATVGLTVPAPPTSASKTSSVARQTKRAPLHTPQPSTSTQNWQDIHSKLRRKIRNGSGIYAKRIRKLNCTQIWALRNAIFARHGYAFKTAAAQNLFGLQEWYQRDSDVTQHTASGYLSHMDYENLETLVRVEKKKCVQ